jgi:hypothetical protein
LGLNVHLAFGFVFRWQAQIPSSFFSRITQAVRVERRNPQTHSDNRDQTSCKTAFVESQLDTVFPYEFVNEASGAVSSRMRFSGSSSTADPLCRSTLPPEWSQRSAAAVLNPDVEMNRLRQENETLRITMESERQARLAAEEQLRLSRTSNNLNGPIACTSDISALPRDLDIDIQAGGTSAPFMQSPFTPPWSPPEDGQVILNVEGDIPEHCRMDDLK